MTSWLRCQATPWPARISPTPILCHLRISLDEARGRRPAPAPSGRPERCRGAAQCINLGDAHECTHANVLLHVMTADALTFGGVVVAGGGGGDDGLCL